MNPASFNSLIALSLPKPLYKLLLAEPKANLAIIDAVITNAFPAKLEPHQLIGA